MACWKRLKEEKHACGSSARGSQQWDRQDGWEPCAAVCHLKREWLNIGQDLIENFHALCKSHSPRKNTEKNLKSEHEQIILYNESTATSKNEPQQFL